VAVAGGLAGVVVTSAAGPEVIHTLLPDQFLVAPTAQLALPQRRLMMAVLQTVIDDVQGSAHRRASGCLGPADQRELERARAYVTSTDRSWPFSFENVCEAVGVDAAGLRRALDRLLDGPPGRDVEALARSTR
jgi:hypothetical protein